MLVITDKATFRIGRKGGLASSREAEEDSCVLAVHVAVSRAVHRSDALERQIVVHHREHTLLHLTAVPGVEDHLLTGLGVESHTSIGVQTEFLVVLNLCLRCIVDDKVGLEVCEFLLCWTDEHVLNEVSLPSNLDDEANSQAGSLVGAAECINDIEILVRKFLLGNLLHSIPNLLSHGVVVVLVAFCSPPNVVVALVVIYDILVLRRTAGEDTSHYVHSTKLSLLTLLITSEGGIGLSLEQLFVGRIVSNHGRTRDTILCQIQICHNTFLNIKE